MRDNNLFMLIESKRFNFTSVEQVIADYFLGKNPPLSIDELSKKVAVSPASITRFAKKLNLNNYKELIFLYQLSFAHSEQERPISTSIAASYHALATTSDQQYKPAVITQFCQAIHEKKLIHYWGLGFNSYAGMDLQFRFARLGKYIQVISDNNSIAMSAHFIEKEDLVIVASQRGEDCHLEESMRLAKEKGCEVLLITANRKSQLIPHSHHVLFAPELSEEEALGQISPQIPMLIQLDMIYSQYVQLYETTIRQWVESEQILTDKHK